jgi:hypothetical protein
MIEINRVNLPFQLLHSLKKFNEKPEIFFGQEML